ncbi:MAG: hypothetical protein QHH30_09815 [candidate division NC10 bacterium]|nr:hypothetical protein [candidate division NC10 bacterium]
MAAFAATEAQPQGAPTPASKSTPSLLLIANKSEDTVSFVDLESLQLLGKAHTGRGPHEVVVTPDGRLAFTANYEGPGDSISMIDVKHRKEMGRISLEAYRRPHGLGMSGDGRMLYVTCEANEAIIEIEVASKKIRRAFFTDQKITHMLTLTPDGRKLYAANLLSGTVTALDLAEGRVIAQIPTGDGCEGLEISPDGKELWATNREAGTLSIIEVEKDQGVDSLSCPGFPIRLKFTPDGRMALVSCYLEGSIAIFDVAKRREIKRLQPTGSSALRHPIGLLIEPNGRRAFLSNSGADEVVVIDLEGLSIMNRIPAGKEPDGLAIAPFTQ